MAPAWCELVKRLQKEAPLGKTRMWDMKMMGVVTEIVGSHYVNVDHAVGIRPVGATVRSGRNGSFYFLKACKDLFRFQITVEGHADIEKRMV